MPQWLSSLWWTGWWWFSFILLTLGFSFRLEGRGKIPRRGPLLIIANHQSFFDPIVMGLACPRMMRFLARKTLFKPAWFAWFITSFGAVPVDQEGVAKEGLKTILRLLQEGNAVVVYPEGTRTPDGKLSPLKPGIQLLIRRTQAPIVVMGIAGAFEAMPYWRSWPTFSPMFVPAGPTTIAVTVRGVLDAQRFVDMPREQLLVELTTELQKAKDRAEQIRRRK
jgi:1-acyl-sn-glycerol-3-phosphate acyltransferase